MAGSESILKRLASGVVASAPQDQKKIKAVLAELVGKRKTLGVYLTTTQPHTKVIEWLKKEKIDSSSLFFLDLLGREETHEENLFVLRDPSDLTELSVVITEILENESISFMVLDGLSGMESYAESASVKRFLHALVAYVKKLKKTLVIFYSGKESAELMSFMVQVSDYHEE